MTYYANCAHHGAKLLLPRFRFLLIFNIMLSSFLLKFSLSYHRKTRVSIYLRNFSIRIGLQSKSGCAIIIGVEYQKTKIRWRFAKVGGIVSAKRAGIGGNPCGWCLPKFDLGVFCEKQNVRAALKGIEWQHSCNLSGTADRFRLIV